MIGTILLVILILLLLGSVYPYGGPPRHGYGYAPGGLVGVLLIVLLVLLIMGAIPW